MTRAAAEDIRAAEGHPQKEQRFQPLALPTHEAVIWHRNYLISMGLLQNHDDRRVKADKIALDLCSVWEGQEIPHRPLRRVKEKVLNLLKDAKELLKHVDPPKPLPLAAELFDISCSCVATVKERDLIPEEVDIRTGKLSDSFPCGCANKDQWTKEAVVFYKDQRFNAKAPTLAWWLPEPRDPDLGELQDEADGEDADPERRGDDGDNCQVEVAAEERLMLEDDSEGDPFDQDDNLPPDDDSLAAAGSHGGLSLDANGAKLPVHRRLLFYH